MLQSSGESMDILGVILSIIGLGVGYYGIQDARKQRGEREKAVLAASGVIKRTEGLLIGLKPGVPVTAHAAINDGLAAIKAAEDSMKNL
jgi:hypothetical protein